MSRFLSAIILIVLLGSCSGTGYGTPPRNLDDACAILDERPEYRRAFEATERRWGVPVHVQMATIYQESKFVSDARTPRRFALGIIPVGRISTAYGYSQALDGTWEDYQRDQRRWGARRHDVFDSADFIGWYMAGTRRELGIGLDDARNQYLAYHEGRAGYRRGNHRRKRWLLRVADDVATRAANYRIQLQGCRGGGGRFG